MQEKCRICGNEQLDYFRLPVETYLTSDLKDWSDNPPPLFFECACNYIGKSNLDESYKTSLFATYSDYSPYSNSLGNEQIVFNQAEGKYTQRSDILLENLLSNFKSPINTDTVLEILEFGCGNGPFLSSLEKSNFESYILDAFDVNDRFEPYLRTKKNFRNFYMKEEEFSNSKYNLIVMAHVLEHLREPSLTIQDLLKILKQDGELLIQVPNSEINYFDYLIADHLSHFTLSTLLNLVRKNPCKIVRKNEDMVPKEITIVLSPSSIIHEDLTTVHNLKNRKDIIRFFELWRKLIESFDAHDNIMIFGTSIGSTWLFNELAKSEINVVGFLDEDFSKVGKLYKGKPVIDVQKFELETNTKMLIPLAPNLVSIIFRKYKDKFPEAQSVNNDGIYKIKDLL